MSRHNLQGIKQETYPDFPGIMEAKAICPNTYHSPSIQYNDSHGNCVEHGFRIKLITALDKPKHVDTDSLDWWVLADSGG
jgi:hypothetical protein